VKTETYVNYYNPALLLANQAVHRTSGFTLTTLYHWPNHANIYEQYTEDLDSRLPYYSTKHIGRTTILSWILHQKWYTKQKEDITDESVHIVTAAVKLITDEIRQKQYTSVLSHQISDQEMQEQCIRSLLHLPEKVKQAAFCHAVV